MTDADGRDRQAGEGCSVDQAGNISDEAFHDDLWDSIPAAAKHAVKMDNVRRVMGKYGFTFEEAAALYYPDWQDYRGDDQEKADI